jgi:molybdate transport system regulatory protein
MTIEATITLGSAGVRSVSRHRIELLQAVGRSGSIRAGARATGVSYKTASNALAAMEQLFGQRLLDTWSGGSAGGGARLTPTGLRVIEIFARLEAELASALGFVQSAIAVDGASHDPCCGPTPTMSSQNAFHGVIVSIGHDGFGADVAVDLSDHVGIVSFISDDSLSALGVRLGDPATVLIDASSVLIAPGSEAPLLSAQNCLCGVVRKCMLYPVTAEIELEIGRNHRITASVTARAAVDLKLSPGDPAYALFDAAHVTAAFP